VTTLKSEEPSIVRFGRFLVPVKHVMRSDVSDAGVRSQTSSTGGETLLPCRAACHPALRRHIAAYAITSSLSETLFSAMCHGPELGRLTEWLGRSEGLHIPRRLMVVTSGRVRLVVGVEARKTGTHQEGQGCSSVNVGHRASSKSLGRWDSPTTGLFCRIAGLFGALPPSAWRQVPDSDRPT
jgi:hypothetical protein